MNLVLLIQFQGQGARTLSADEQTGTLRYAIDVDNVLETLNIPRPARLVPIWKSGIVRGIYSKDATTLGFCEALDTGFAHARSSRGYSLLERHSIKFLKVMDGHSQKCYLASSGREQRRSLVAEYLHTSSSPSSSAVPSTRRLSHSSSANTNADIPNKRQKRTRVSTESYVATMDKLLSIRRVVGPQSNTSVASLQNTANQSSGPCTGQSTPFSISPTSTSNATTENSVASGSTLSMSTPNAVELTLRALDLTRKELYTLRSKEAALIARYNQLNGVGLPQEGNFSEAFENSFSMKEAPISKLETELRSARLENQTLHSQLQAERTRREQLENLLAKAQNEKNGPIFAPAMLSAMERLSRLSEEVLEAARKGD